MDTARTAFFARLAEAAYQDEAGCRAFLASEGLILHLWIDCGSTEGFVACRPEGFEAYVVIRGTSERADVAVDLRAHKVQASPIWSKGRVHAGFASALAAAWPEVFASLELLRRQRGGLVTWFCGHSLGGAVATLAAAKARASKIGMVGGVITFGCPRVGDRAFARSLEKELGRSRFLRCVNNSDVVPRLLFLTYLHLGVLAYITRKGALVTDPGFWFVFWDSLLGRIRGRWLNPFSWRTDGLRDHSIRQYRLALEALEKRGA